MKWPTIRNSATGEHATIGTISPRQLRDYLNYSQGWYIGAGRFPWSSLEVRRMIAARLLAGAV